MARIKGVDIPNDKQVETSITYIYGIGRNLAKKIVAGGLAAVIVSGMVAIPKLVKAAEDIVDGKIIYSQMDMAKYWSTGTKTAPVKENYIFAGWYTADANNEVTAIKEAEGIPADATTYAKFVPAYVLSIKTQVEKDAEMLSTEVANKGDNFSTFMRVLSSVDSGDYQNVGFEIILGNEGTTTFDVKPITKVYAGLKLSETDTDDEIIRPNKVFGEAATYFTALDLEGINIKSFSSKIYIRPYWTTLDGTKVEGLAKNVRVEDKYTNYRYLSMPVNLLTDGATPTQIAAGILEVSYDATKFDGAKDANGKARIDTGRLMSEMEYNIILPAEGETMGKIVFSGNVETAKDVKEADGLFANIRFIRKDGYNDAKEADLLIDKEVQSFCDWNETLQTVIAW